MSDLKALAREQLGRFEDFVRDFFERSPTHARVKQLLLTLDRHLTLRTASAMAFDLFMAVVPMLGLAGYAASYVLRSQPQALVEGSQLLDLAPARLHDFIVNNVTAFAETEVGPLFAVLVLWLSSSAFLTMIRVFEESFGFAPRSYLRARLLALGFATVALVLFVLASAAGAFLTWQGIVPEQHKHRIGELVDFLPTSLARFQPLGVVALLLSVCGIVLYLALIYRFAVVRKGIRRRFFPGAIIATAIGLFGSFLFAYYVTNISRYAVYYGGLVVIVVVLLWLWLWCSAILVGAEINVALEDAGAFAKGREPTVVQGPRPDQGAGAEPVGPMHTPSAMGNPEGD